MEIIIDEFFYPTHRSFLSKLRHFLKYLKQKSYIFLIFLLFYLFFRRFSLQIPLNWSRIILGKSLLPTKTPIKSQENEELLRKLKLFDLVLSEKTEKFSEPFQQYRQEIEGMFTLEHLRDNLSQSSHLIDQRIALFDCYKSELLTFSCLWFFSKHILELLPNIKAVLQMKYLEKFKRKYHNTISEVDKMTDYIINEFYDSLLHTGLKNLIFFIKKALNPILLPYKSGIEYDFNDMIVLLNDIEKKMLMLNTKDLNLPDDNKRWSCYCLTSLQKVKQKTPKKKITFTDFNVVSTEMLEIEDEDPETRAIKPTKKPAILFPKEQGLSIPKNTMDLLSIFIGDISNHKYFIDQDYIERYIIMADRDARAERYRSYLEEIREENEPEEISEGYYSEEQKEKEGSEANSCEEDHVKENESQNFNEDEKQTIEEARYYFALILKLFCGEIIDFLESGNLNIYIFYAMKYEFFCLKSSLDEGRKGVNGKKMDLEGWMDQIFSEVIGNKEKGFEELNDESVNKEKKEKFKELLKETRDQIYKSLFLTTNEYEEVINGERRKGEKKEKIGKYRKILDYLINYGIGD